jgi:hypothetical protein
VADLKLGPLPKQSTVKITVLLTELLKEELDAYAACTAGSTANPSQPQH